MDSIRSFVGVLILELSNEFEKIAAIGQRLYHYCCPDVRETDKSVIVGLVPLNLLRT